jgi:competence protein ComEC
MIRRSLWKLLFVLLAVSGLLLGWNLTHRQGDGLLHVTFLDVGQGDSCVIETPSGKVIVIDTGEGGQEEGDDAGRKIVGPFLLHEGIGRIDTLILTHPHADHIGGAATLLRRFDVGLLLDNGEPTRSPLVTQYLEMAWTRHVPVKAARRGQRLDCGDGVMLDILAPTSLEAQTEAETNGAANNASVVARLRYGRTAFLFTGDAEADEETDLATNGLPLDCDVLKAGHHGSRTSTTPAFLARVHPREAIISVGARNLYGHPSGDVLARLRAGRVHVFRTDLNGAIVCTSNGVVVCAQAMHPTTP